MRATLPSVALTLSAAISVPAVAGNVDLPRYPAISPDGSRVTYSWRGDIWSVSSDGGQAIRLTSHPSVDTRTAWSPDGSWIAFESERDGASNLFLMRPDGSGIRQITFTDRPCTLAGFSSDGDELLFESSREGDVYRDTRLYSVSVDGGPITRLLDCFGSHPVASPDGSMIAFERGGSSWSRRHYRGPDDRDVWVYDTRATAFRRLTDWTGNDGMARWLDSDTLVFASDRTQDTVNLYAMDIDAPGNATRLTSFNGTDVWDFDVATGAGRAVLLVWDTLYTLDLSRPGAAPRALDIHASADSADAIELKSVSDQASEARLSPDGKALAVVAYGELFVRGLEDDSPTARLTRSVAREHDIAWSPDGTTLYFVSDADGTDSIYAATVAETREDLRKALAPPEPKPEQADEAQATQPEAPEDASDEQPDDTEPESDDADKQEDSTDEEKKSDEPEKIVQGDRWADAIRFNIEPVVATEHNDARPMPSPDGRTLAFLRTRGDLILKNLATGEETLYHPSWDSWRDVQWSPDSRHLAWSVNDRDFNSDIWIAPAEDAGAAVNISRHPDSDYAPRWSADGKVLAFLSDRQNNESDVWLVFLDRDMESMSGRELRDYFEEAAKAAKKREPLSAAKNDEASDEAEAGAPDEAPEAEPLDLEDAYRRLRRVSSHPGSESGLLITPGGDRLVFSRSDPEGGMVSVKWDGSELKKLGDSGSIEQISLTGDRVVFIRNGRAGTTGPEGGESKTFGVSQTLRIELAEQSAQKFAEAARILGTSFYHPDMKGLDWASLTERYADLASRAHTDDEFDDVASRFLGELNASHLGVFSPGDDAPAAQANGRLGIDAAPADGGWLVQRVLRLGPGDNGAMSLREGDLITAIDFQPVSSDRSLESHLKGMIGDEVPVTVARSGDDGARTDLTLLLRPISYGAENNLRYDDWQRNNARLVDEWSNGRIGYLHIRSMGAESLVEFERDLYAAAHGKDGLLIDVRNNGGGWTADLVMAALTYQPHAYTIPRGADPDEDAGYPRDRLFIQRYTGPANMLCNEKSFSNAEIVSHAFKTVGRGRLVGQQTYGGVISTGGTRLIDGTWVRIPFRGWYLPDGTDMENNGAMPDVLVPQTPEDEAAGFDRQLRAAVDDLLARLP